ncbi:DUF167 family protein [Magnetospirillum sulfuroxidans]|uniref:UPF0235 protein KEC16_08955 n=1 Tax=Magnetospirillum sulfuroxidans TaxID=611300 RepID=A0ABS5IDN8_9PROT|nr:DUF167 family protein [Magnetospirillum sulfuroxidans]MBR9971843.1 DUF167 domain-containing protein [Magnetospirillum sulfuroxidans]
MSPAPYSLAPQGLKVFVRLTPKASRDKVDGLAAEADGGVVVKAAVTAVPEDGKANAALIKMLAKEWRVAKSLIEIVAGATDRRKTLLISGDGAELAARLDQWMAKRS